MKTIIIALIAALSTVSLMGGIYAIEVYSPAPVTSHGGPVTDYVSLIDNLRASGATVSPAGNISQPFFSVEGKTISVNNEQIQIFEYIDQEAAEEEAKQVSSDGSSVGLSMILWVDTLHFYKEGNLIVLYIGDDSTTNNTLENLLGTQFAGR